MGGKRRIRSAARYFWLCLGVGTALGGAQRSSALDAEGILHYGRLWWDPSAPHKGCTNNNTDERATTTELRRFLAAGASTQDPGFRSLLDRLPGQDCHDSSHLDEAIGLFVEYARKASGPRRRELIEAALGVTSSNEGSWSLDAYRLFWQFYLDDVINRSFARQKNSGELIDLYDFQALFNMGFTVNDPSFAEDFEPYIFELYLPLAERRLCQSMAQGGLPGKELLDNFFGPEGRAGVLSILDSSAEMGLKEKFAGRRGREFALILHELHRRIDQSEDSHARTLLNEIASNLADAGTYQRDDDLRLAISVGIRWPDSRGSSVQFIPALREPFPKARPKSKLLLESLLGERNVSRSMRILATGELLHLSGSLCTADVPRIRPALNWLLAQPVGAEDGGLYDLLRELERSLQHVGPCLDRAEIPRLMQALDDEDDWKTRDRASGKFLLYADAADRDYILSQLEAARPRFSEEQRNRYYVILSQMAPPETFDDVCRRVLAEPEPRLSH